MVPPASEARHSRSNMARVMWIFALVALIVPTARHSFLLGSRGGSVPIRLDDDAFFYLVIAQNIVRGLGSTFDGLSPTNGYHPVWLGILVPLAALTPSDDWLLVAVYGLNSALWALAVLLLAAIGAQLRCERQMVFALPVLIWYGATWGGRGHHLFFTGLEIGLVMVLLLLFAQQALSAGLFDRPMSRWRCAALGALLGLLVLTRLDAVFVAATLIALLSWSTYRRESSMAAMLSQALPLTVPVALALVLYTGFNLAVAGTPLAISGQAKSLYGPWFSTGNLEIILDHGTFQKAPVFSGALLLSLSVAAALFVPNHQPADRSWRLLVIALTLGFVLQAAAWWIFYIPGAIRGYYFYVTPIVASLALPRLIAWLQLRLDVTQAPIVAPASGAALLLVWGLLWPQDWGGRAIDAPTDSLDHGRATSAWLAANTPDTTRYAMADGSGVIGFLLKRPVFQLEGLVNSPNYLRDLSAGRVDVDYLLDRGISVFILSEHGERRRDAGGCIVAPASEERWWPPVELRLCPEDLIWHAKTDTGGIVTVWRLRTRNPE